MNRTEMRIQAGVNKHSWGFLHIAYQRPTTSAHGRTEQPGFPNTCMPFLGGVERVNDPPMHGASIYPSIHLPSVHRSVGRLTN